MDIYNIIRTMLSNCSSNTVIKETRFKISYFDSISEVQNAKEENIYFSGFSLFFIFDGSVELNENNKRYIYKKGDILFFSPNELIQPLFSIDIRLCVITFSDQYITYLKGLFRNEWESFGMEDKYRLLHSQDEDISRYDDYIKLLDKTLQLEETPYRHLIEDSLLCCIVYDFILKKNINTVFNSKKIIYRDNAYKLFSEMIAGNQQFGMVKQYAEKLNISAKYLSTICKNRTGKTAYTLLEEAKIKQSKALLSNTELNIKQIAFQLNFKNPSHFGKFFKEHTGISPLCYRKQERTMKLASVKSCDAATAEPEIV